MVDLTTGVSIFALGCTAHLLDHSGVVSGVNFLRLGCSAEQTRNFTVPFLVGFFCEREVARMGITFAVESGLQVVECCCRGGSPAWQGNQGERKSEQTISEPLHNSILHFSESRSFHSDRSPESGARIGPTIDLRQVVQNKL